MTFNLDDAVAVLTRTPAALRAMLEGLPPAWVQATEGPDTWSPYVVMGHLIHCEREDWMRRAEMVLAQGSLRKFTPLDRTAQLRERQDQPLSELLDTFADLRTTNLETLAGWGLTDEQLALEGEHPEFGAVTLRQLLATWVAHDLGHLVQINRVMARQYRDAVGPWHAYLSVMR
jgi:DinB superfamily